VQRRGAAAAARVAAGRAARRLRAGMQRVGGGGARAARQRRLSATAAAPRNRTKDKAAAERKGVARRCVANIARMRRAKGRTVSWACVILALRPHGARATRQRRRWWGRTRGKQVAAVSPRSSRHAARHAATPPRYRAAQLRPRRTVCGRLGARGAAGGAARRGGSGAARVAVPRATAVLVSSSPKTSAAERDARAAPRPHPAAPALLGSAAAGAAREDVRRRQVGPPASSG
jgi:hypothetical protein